MAKGNKWEAFFVCGGTQKKKWTKYWLWKIMEGSMEESHELLFDWMIGMDPIASTCGYIFMFIVQHFIKNVILLHFIKIAITC